MLLNQQQAWGMRWWFSGASVWLAAGLIALAPFTYGDSLQRLIGYSPVALGSVNLYFGLIIGVSGLLGSLGLLHFARYGARGSGAISLGVIGIAAAIACAPLVLVIGPLSTLPWFLAGVGFLGVAGGVYQRCINNDPVYLRISKNPSTGIPIMETKSIKPSETEVASNATSSLAEDLPEKKLCSPAVSDHYLKGHQHLSEREYTKAVLSFNFAVESGDDFARLWLYILHHSPHYGVQDAKAADKARSGVLDSDVLENLPQNQSLPPDRWLGLAYLYQNENFFKEAGSCYSSYEALCKVHNKSFDICYYQFRGEGSLLMGNYHIARQYFVLANEKDPKFTPARLGLGQCQWYMSSIQSADSSISDSKSLQEESTQGSIPSEVECKQNKVLPLVENPECDSIEDSSMVEEKKPAVTSVFRAFTQAYDDLGAGKLKDSYQKFDHITYSKTECDDDKLFALMWLNYLYPYHLATRQFDEKMSISDSNGYSRYFNFDSISSPISPLVNRSKAEMLAKLTTENSRKVKEILIRSEHPEATADILRLVADLYARGIAVKRDLAKALSYLDRVLQQSPQDVFSWYRRGLIHRESEQYSAAITDLEQAVKFTKSEEERQKFIDLRHQYITVFESLCRKKNTSAIKARLVAIKDSKEACELNLQSYRIDIADMFALLNAVKNTSQISALHLDNLQLTQQDKSKLIAVFQEALLESKSITPQQLGLIDWNILSKEQTIALLTKIKDWEVLDLSQAKISSSAAFFVLTHEEFPEFKNLKILNLSHKRSHWVYKLASVIPYKFKVLQELDLSDCELSDLSLSYLVKEPYKHNWGWASDLRLIKLKDNRLKNPSRYLIPANAWIGASLALDLSGNLLNENYPLLQEVVTTQVSVQRQACGTLQVLSRPEEMLSLVPVPAEYISSIKKPRKLSETQWLVYVYCPKKEYHIGFCVEGITVKGQRILRTADISNRENRLFASTGLISIGCDFEQLEDEASNPEGSKFALLAKISATKGWEIIRYLDSIKGLSITYALLASVYDYAGSFFSSSLPSSPRVVQNCGTWTVDTLRQFGIELPQARSAIPNTIVTAALERERRAEVPFILDLPSKKSPSDDKTKAISLTMASSSTVLDPVEINQTLGC